MSASNSKAQPQLAQPVSTRPTPRVPAQPVPLKKNIKKAAPPKGTHVPKATVPPPTQNGEPRYNISPEHVKGTHLRVQCGNAEPVPRQNNNSLPPESRTSKRVPIKSRRNEVANAIGTNNASTTSPRKSGYQHNAVGNRGGGKRTGDNNLLPPVSGKRKLNNVKLLPTYLVV
ncbi:hypothetical protein JVT61DRAFT_4744 [Boletus reticuloceps]|uniref:Uncharacterized protein n=1 Tax=Boletus reticuloceps TaxID=495285 RepID=A0A8I3A732_9AGAM|nr:hypothetical protein JVT61DRAFT_4744 [Boletus reticuloceps]